MTDRRPKRALVSAAVLLLSGTSIGCSATSHDDGDDSATTAQAPARDAGGVGAFTSADECLLLLPGPTGPGDSALEVSARFSAREVELAVAGQDLIAFTSCGDGGTERSPGSTLPSSVAGWHVTEGRALCSDDLAHCFVGGSIETLEAAARAPQTTTVDQWRTMTGLLAERTLGAGEMLPWLEGGSLMRLQPGYYEVRGEGDASCEAPHLRVGWQQADGAPEVQALCAESLGPDVEPDEPVVVSVPRAALVAEIRVALDDLVDQP